MHIKQSGYFIIKCVYTLRASFFTFIFYTKLNLYAFDYHRHRFFRRS